MRVKVFGISRPLSSIENLHGDGLQLIPDTFASEDIHYHTPSGLIYGVAEVDEQSRNNWFPPTACFNYPDTLNQGIIFTIDPKSQEKTQLTLAGFTGPFVTHGIDIYTPSSSPSSVYIFAVNHLPNPAYSILKAADVPKARSQIEIFEHTLGTKEAKYLRSIRNPLIRTPNDILIENEHSIYVTNDHYTREGIGRTFEALGWHQLAAWSDITHVGIEDLNAKDASAAVKATVALDKIHNPNGFGHGKSKDEILVGRASAGVMHIMKARPSDHKLEILESLQLPNTIDNPSYFHDPYAASTGRDASGYVLAGLTRAIAFPTAQKNPTSVWLVNEKSKEQKLVFQDDGTICNTTSTAIIVGIDPKGNGGKKQGWLYVTGPMSQGVVRTKIDL